MIFAGDQLYEFPIGAFNCIDALGQIIVSAPKSTIGKGFTTTFLLCTSIQPSGLVTVNTICLVPGVLYVMLVGLGLVLFAAFPKSHEYPEILPLLLFVIKMVSKTQTDGVAVKLALTAG
jgi:hypothetical protein